MAKELAPGKKIVIDGKPAVMLPCVDELRRSNGKPFKTPGTAQSRRKRKYSMRPLYTSHHYR